MEILQNLVENNIQLYKLYNFIHIFGSFCLKYGKNTKLENGEKLTISGLEHFSHFQKSYF